MAGENNKDNYDAVDGPQSGAPAEEAAPAGKKPKKSPKQPAAAAPPVPEAETGKKGKKKAKVKKRGRLKVILIIVLVLLIAGFVFEEIYFNYLGGRDILIDSVVKLDPDYRTRERQLDEREAEIAVRETELLARETEAAKIETQNTQRAADLDAREQSMEVTEEENLLPLYLRQMTEQERADMESLSSYYSQMAPETAVLILLDLDSVEHVAAILYFMGERNASAILAAFDPVYAARITEVLLYP